MAVLDPATGVTEPLLRGRTPGYEPLTGHLVFLGRSALMAVAFDPTRAAVTGDPFVVAENIGAFGLAGDGTLWYVQGTIGRDVPVMVDARGQRREIMPEVGDREAFHDAAGLTRVAPAPQPRRPRLRLA